MVMMARRGLIAVLCVAGLALPASAGILTFDCTFPDDPDGVYHDWTFTDELVLDEALPAVAPDQVVMSGETDSDPTFHVVKTVENNSGLTWQSYWLTLTGDVTFVAPASSDKFQNTSVAAQQIIFWVPDPVLQGETVTLEFDINVPSEGLFEFTLTQLPDTDVPEPATLSLLALGGLAALRRRR
jgi:hypothetical protein